MAQQTAVVDTKSPWSSKVNWVAGATALAGTLSQLLPFLPPPYSGYVTIGIIVLGGLATVVTKTFYTTTISSASLPTDAPTSVVIHTDAEERAETESLNVTQAALGKSKV